MKKSFVLGLGMAAINPVVAQTTGEKPVLWIIADDLGTDLACYGNKSVRTPNTDRLASEGITFTGLHSVTAVSSPGRSSLITGMYPVSVNIDADREESFSFAFMTDIHLDYNQATLDDFRRAVNKLNSLSPDFVLTGGDNVRDVRRGRESYADSLYNLYKSEIKMLGMPVYTGFGNHESFGVDNPPSLPQSPAYGKNMFMEKIGPTYYSFVHKGWKFFMLDNVFDTLSGRYRYIGRIDDAQMKWIEKELASTDKDMPVVICCHIPFVSSMKKFELGSLSGNPVNDGVENSIEFFRLFKDHKIKLILQGHFHFFEVLYANDAYYITGPSPNRRFGNPTSAKFGMFMFKAENDSLTWKFIEN